MAVAADNAYLNTSGLAFFEIADLNLAKGVDTRYVLAYCLPSKDILCVVVPQIHFSWPAYWDPYSLSVIRFQKVRY